MSDDWKNQYTTVTVSQRLLDQGFIVPEFAYRDMFRRRSPEELAELKAKREAEWDEKIAAGFVPIEDVADEGRANYQKVDVRGSYVERWVTAASWERYTLAWDALNLAEDFLDEAQ